MFFIVALILFILTGVISVNMWKNSESVVKNDLEPVRAIVTVICIATLIAIPFSMIKIIQPGHMATTELFGTVHDKILTAGINFVNPFYKVRDFNIQTVEYTATLSTPASDQMTMGIDLTIQYSLNPAYVVDLRKTVGTDEDVFNEVLFIPGVRGCLRDAGASFASAELYISRRDEFKSVLSENLIKQFEKSYIISGVIIRNVTPPGSIINAIEEKQKAEQEAQKMKFVLERTELEAQQKVIEARGIRDSQDIIAQKLTKEYLMWYKIDMMRQLVNSPNNTVIFIPDDMASVPPIILDNSKR